MENWTYLIDDKAGAATRATSSGSGISTTALRGRKEANMASNTTTHKPTDGVRERTVGDYPQPALENRPTVDNPPGADRNADIVLTAAVIAMGLFAGLFFTFSTAVMPGLAAADDRTLVDAMQQMIENPTFPLTFFVAGVLTAVALFQAYRAGAGRVAGWIAVSLALYTVTSVVTFVIHLPLNDDLMNAGAPDRIENLAAVRDDFVTPWVAWDIVRTLASTAAFGSLAWALVLRGRKGRANHLPRTVGYVHG
jgi:uncharacterized membrane protein